MTGTNSSAHRLVRTLGIFQLRDTEEILNQVANALAEHLNARAVAIVADGAIMAQAGSGASEQQVICSIAAGEEPTGPGHVLHFPVSNESDNLLVVLRDDRPFDAEEKMAATAMARMMCQAVRTAEAVQDERRTARQLSEQLEENRALNEQLIVRRVALAERLAEIQTLVAAGDLTDETFPSVIRQAANHFPGGELALHLVGESGGVTAYSSNRRCTEPLDATDDITRHHVSGSDLKASEDGSRLAEYRFESEDGWRSAIAASVYLRGEPHGELAVSYPVDSGGANEHDREAVAILAGFLSLAITELEARRQVTVAYNDVEWRATHDLVTGLLNRASFVAKMNQRLSTGQQVTVLYLDLDGFKTINDHYGHATGDRVLVETASRMQTELREGTVIARLAGDEFAVLVDLSTEEAVAMAGRIRARLEQPIVGKVTDSALVTASIGIAHGKPGWSAEDILDSADIAMYTSKQLERGTVTVFDNSLRMARNRKIEIERQLKVAVTTMEGFHLAYLPTTDLSTGERTAVEALLRWEHESLGLVPPDEFIGIAEQAGLIRDIDSWVIATALGAMADHIDDTDLGLSVNLSPASFDHPDLVGMVAELLVRHRFPASRLTLEITERVLLHDLDRVVPVLDRLHGLGIKIALDDFGAGYSSFTYLQSRWIDVLKIDRMLLPNSEHDSRAIAILRALRSLCTELDLEAVIEGVDSEFQRSTVRSLGFRQAQGFLWGRPGPLESTLTTPDRHLRAVTRRTA